MMLDWNEYQKQIDKNGRTKASQSGYGARLYDS
jgi:hypothetical protein